jgi:pimeloyl-ACP methyl ester carboxylesterase
VADPESGDLDAEIQKCRELLMAHGYRVLAPDQRLPGGSRDGDPEATLAEVAVWIPCSVFELRRAARSGELATVNRRGPGGKSRYFVTHRGLADWLEKRGWSPDRVALLRRVAARTDRTERTDRAPRVHSV